MSYAAVFPLVRTRAFAEAFDYEVPAHLAAAAQAGALVAAPLGARTVIGVVLEIRDASGHEGRVLPLHDVLHVPPVPPGLLDLARRVERHYLSSFAAALTLVCPPVGALKVDRRYELTEAGAAAVAARTFSNWSRCSTFINAAKSPRLASSTSSPLIVTRQISPEASPPSDSAKAA